MFYLNCNWLTCLFNVRKKKRKKRRTVQVEVLCVYIGDCSNTPAITNEFVKCLFVYLFQLEHCIVRFVCLFELMGEKLYTYIYT